ncbi:MAG: TRIC cation channel family protein, partial [Chromatiales bacterium]|nr:TRIC cation channel family protein [Chromatiales bacterium]
ACYTRMPSIMLMYADAVGLAVFMFVGYQKGFEMTQAYSIGIVMGVISGVVGGIIRDVLSGEIPLIFRREIYASAALTGATLLALLSYLEVPGTITVPAAVLTTLVIRLAAIHWNLALPLFHLDGKSK